MVHSPQNAWQTIAHRLRAAWKAWSGVRNQVRAPRISFDLPAQLLEGVVLPSLLWGMESLSLTRPQRDKLSTIQRVMLGRMLHLFQRPREARDAFFRRRERCISAAIKQHCRAEWGRLQRFRFLTFAGHIQRTTDEHDVRRIVTWRDSRWWETYRSSLPAKRGGQRGRRPANKSLPCRQEVGIHNTLQNLRTRACWPNIRDALMNAGITDPEIMHWKDMATIRGAWRAFARWAAFKAEP